MKIVKNKDTEDSREFWSHVESVAKQIDSWPSWMGNREKNSDSKKDPDQPHSASPQNEQSSE